MSNLATSIPYLISFASVLATFYGIRHTNKANAELQDARLASDRLDQQQNILRAKGEELCMLTEEFKSDLAKSISDMLITLHQEGNGKAAETANIRNSNDASRRIEMLTRIYFPKEESALRSLQSNHGAILAEMIKIVGCDNNAKVAALSLALMKMTSELTTLSYALQKAVIEDIRESGAGISRGIERA